ncbi:beta-galactosidase [Microbacterium sp. LWS13-1.2]|uniref:Beta-galactosidase n=1 Tax=Microbacterium sp. LWS13-1.2 TaxID=3135264 RepID=A0AAU6SEF3_9MICO
MPDQRPRPLTEVTILGHPACRPVAARLPELDHLAYGGDYSPEQWPDEIWDRDYEAFDAARITTVTVGVFTWALTQPDEDVPDFPMLDKIVQRAADEGRSICLGTGTGALPPWVARNIPTSHESISRRRRSPTARTRFCTSRCGRRVARAR